jgi:hypothetical protein
MISLGVTWAQYLGQVFEWIIAMSLGYALRVYQVRRRFERTVHRARSAWQSWDDVEVKRELSAYERISREVDVKNAPEDPDAFYEALTGQKPPSGKLKDE